MIRHSNDQAISMFLASIGRCIGALHEVIVNRRTLARELTQIRTRREKAAAHKLEHERNKIDEASRESVHKKAN